MLDCPRWNRDQTARRPPVTGPFDATIAVIVIGLLNLFIATRIGAHYPSQERRFLRRTYVQALALRSAGALALNVLASNVQFAGYFWGDSGTYDAGGYHLALRWSGEIVAGPYRMSVVSGYGFTHLVGLLYYVFGRNQLLIQLVNATIASLAVVVIYAIARRLFDEGVARWAALFMGFFPQMIFWSCAMYKDPAILLCIATSIYAVLRLRERITAGHLVLFVAATLALMTLRFYVFYMVAFATLGTFLFSQRRGLFSGLFAQILLGGVFATAIVLGVRQETLQQQTAYFDLDRLQNARLGQTMVGQSDFGAEFDVSTPAGAMAAVPVGLAYLLFAPFPWAITGIRQLLTLPETLVWYALMPALWRGLRHALRHKLRAVLPIITFAAILTVAYAVFQSNVGTAYRQRTQVTMFFFIFMGAGIELKRRQKEAARASAAAAQPWRR